jgi:ketosteroid isomerase-like protein
MGARIFSILVLCLLPCFAVRNLAQEKSDVDRIRALESKWVDAYKQRQSVAMAALLAEDYAITLEDGSTYGKVGFISYTARPLRVDLAELSDVKIHIHENTAVVIAGYHERGVLDGKSYDYHDRLTDVWMKINGKWQLIASHYSLPSNL